MHGTAQDFKNDILKKLDEVDLNKLEKALLEKLLETPQDTVEQVTDCLKRARDRLKDEKRMVKQLNRVIPLFDKHEFWDTQPVMRAYKPIGQDCEPIEVKTVAEVSKEPIGLPEQYQWCEINMEDPES